MELDTYIAITSEEEILTLPQWMLYLQICFHRQTDRQTDMRGNSNINVEKENC